MLTVLLVYCSYSKLSEDEVRLDRYAKFRALGQYEEYLVPGGQWRETRAARDKVCATSFAPWLVMFREVLPVNIAAVDDNEAVRSCLGHD